LPFDRNQIDLPRIVTTTTGQNGSVPEENGYENIIQIRFVPLRAWRRWSSIGDSLFQRRDGTECPSGGHYDYRASGHHSGNARDGHKSTSTGLSGKCFSERFI
jgi:hypothetical protein